MIVICKWLVFVHRAEIVKRRPKRDKVKERFGRSNLALLAESGLTRAEFYRQHNINLHTSSYRRSDES